MTDTLNRAQNDFRPALLIGTLIGALLLIALGVILDRAFDSGPLAEFDQELTTDFYDSAEPDRTDIFRTLTRLGNEALYVIGVAGGLYLIWRRRARHFALWTIALVGGQIVKTALKLIFARPRPIFESPLAVEDSFAFPSGHAMMSIIAYGLIVYLLWKALRSPAARGLLVAGMVLLVGLIGLSRLILAVHYFSDVVGGWLLGGLWLLFCIWLVNALTRRFRRGTSDPPPAAHGM
ncbi:MAG: phosphatase PAP2 family protein [Chloroflexi bacterium]|nr:phosphatase PAP2 family protein [Chloroflexota bacterium]